MSNRTFKIVARYSSREKPSWAHQGKAGTQAKKHVYTSHEDYKKYGRKTARQWEGQRADYDVEHYELKKGEWKLINRVVLD
jgi:hypothetical protein